MSLRLKYRPYFSWVDCLTRTGYITSCNCPQCLQQATALGIGRGGGGGNVQTTMLSYQQPINMRWSIVNQGLDGPGGYISVPASTITQRLNVFITRDYNIFISLNEGGVSYSLICIETSESILDLENLY